MLPWWVAAAPVRGEAATGFRMHAKDAVAPLEPQDSSERDSLLLQATPKPSSARAFSFFSFMTHFFAFATFLTVVVLILEHYNFNDDGSYPFGTFGLHPLLMVTAFGLCSPVAMVSYKTYEYLLGVSHGAVKGVHAALQTIAVLIGAVGMASMWKTHEDARHFQTAHSWAGLAGFIVFVLNWLLGMAVFLNPCCPGRIRGALLQPHIVLGTAATVGTPCCMHACMLPCLPVVWRWCASMSMCATAACRCSRFSRWPRGPSHSWANPSEPPRATRMRRWARRR